MPADYVNKLARMFQDIKVSEDLNQAFKEMHKNNKLALPGTLLLTMLYEAKLLSNLQCEIMVEPFLLLFVTASTLCIFFSKQRIL